MTITISNTDKTVKMDGVDARLWEGETADGIQIHCYIVRIGVRSDQDLSQFEKELQETRPPSPELEEIPLRMIL